MAIIDNMDYHKIIQFKLDYERLLDRMLDDDNDSYNIMLQSIVSLFVIDYDNIKKDFFDKDTMEYVTNLIKNFIDNDEDSVNISKEKLNDLLEIHNKGKIKYNVHKALALKLAEIYNESCKNSLKKININTISSICDSFK